MSNIGNGESMTHAATSSIVTLTDRTQYYFSPQTAVALHMSSERQWASFGFNSSHLNKTGPTTGLIRHYTGKRMWKTFFQIPVISFVVSGCLCF